MSLFDLQYSIVVRIDISRSRHHVDDRRTRIAQRHGASTIPVMAAEEAGLRRWQNTRRLL
jgi:hypothetical protein